MSETPVVIIGESGFIGQALKKKLSKMTSQATYLNRNDLRELFRKPDAFAICLNGAHVFIAIGKMDGNPEEIYYTNFEIVTQIIEICNRNKAEMITLFSTGGLDFKTEEKIKESPYLHSKWQAELYLADNSASAYRILRIYFPFGKNQSPNRFLPKLKKSILDAQPIKMRSDGGPRLSLTSVNDIAEYSLDSTRWMNQKNKIVSVSSGNNFSIKVLAEMIAISQNVSSPEIQIDETLEDLIYPATPDFEWSKLEVKYI